MDKIAEYKMNKYSEQNKHQDFLANINYLVYTQDENGDKLRFVGSYPCKCAARDVANHIWETYGVNCGAYRIINVEEF